MVEMDKNGQTAREFAGVFADSLSESLLEDAGIRSRIAVLDDKDLAVQQESLIRFKLTMQGGLRGQSFVEFTETQAANLASKILGQPPSAFSDEYAEVLAKLFSSAISRVSRSMFGAYSEIKCQVDRVDGQAFDEMLVVPLAFAESEQSRTPMMLYFDSELLETLSSRATHKRVTGADLPRLESVNLKLVLDVELNVSLRFGQSQMPLRQVLELGTGSVVELDRAVDDPVELLLDGKVIARGEAVIVDGCYGLRVTEIPQPISSHLVH